MPHFGIIFAPRPEVLNFARQLRQPSAAIRARNGSPRKGGGLLANSPDFEGNNGRPMSLQNDPYLLANRVFGFPKFWVKLRRAGGGCECRQNGASLAAITVRNGDRANGDALPMVFPDLGLILGNPRISKITPFC